ncbi:hypothetical protein ACS0TY_016135 [Phlomoides rotata]
MDDGGDDVLDLGGLLSDERRLMVGRSVCLAGRLFTDKAYNCFALMDVMKKAFKPKGKVTTRDWGAGLIIFSFEREDDRDWAVRNQPWHFDNNLFFIKPLTDMEHPSQICIASFLESLSLADERKGPRPKEASWIFADDHMRLARKKMVGRVDYLDEDPVLAILMTRWNRCGWPGWT